MKKKKLLTEIILAGIALTIILFTPVIITNKSENQASAFTTEQSASESTTELNVTPTKTDVELAETNSVELKRAEEKTVKARTVTVKGVDIPYEAEIGQAGINANHNIATTWGGDFDPNKSTIIAGHDDGPMGAIKELKSGDVVAVTDSEGNEHLYQFQDRRVVRMIFSGRGTGYVENQDDAQYILSQHSGTNLNLQTCVETRADGYSIVFVTLTKM